MSAQRLLSFLRKYSAFVMIGIVLLACLGLFLHQKLQKPESERPLTPVEPLTTIPLTPVDPVELQADWQKSVTSILEDYDKTGDAKSAKERLLVVRVPASGRDAHLALFVAFNALSESRPEGKSKLAQARAVFQTLAGASNSAVTSTPTSSPR